MLFDGIEQVIGLALACILGAKIVNYKGEHKWSPLVDPHARGDRELVVAMHAKALFEELVG